MLTKRDKNILFFAGLILAGAAVGYGLPRLHAALQSHYRTGDYSAYFPRQDVRVVVFGTASCSFCQRARRLLDERGVPYVFEDVQASADAALRHASVGGGGVPVLLIGDRRIQGFWPEEIDRALVALNTRAH